jgi:hypothetical protein
MKKLVSSLFQATLVEKPIAKGFFEDISHQQLGLLEQNRPQLLSLFLTQFLTAFAESFAADCRLISFGP